MRIVVVAESGARLLVAVLLALLVAAAAESEAPPTAASSGRLAAPFITLLFLFVPTATVPISLAIDVALCLAAGSVAVTALQLPDMPFRETCAGRNDRRDDRCFMIVFIPPSDTTTSSDANWRCKY